MSMTRRRCEGRAGGGCRPGGRGGNADDGGARRPCRFRGRRARRLSLAGPCSTFRLGFGDADDRGYDELVESWNDRKLAEATLELGEGGGEVSRPASMWVRRTKDCRGRSRASTSRSAMMAIHCSATTRTSALPSGRVNAAPELLKGPAQLFGQEHELGCSGSCDGEDSTCWATWSKATPGGRPARRTRTPGEGFSNGGTTVRGACPFGCLNSLRGWSRRSWTHALVSGSGWAKSARFGLVMRAWGAVRSLRFQGFEPPFLRASEKRVGVCRARLERPGGVMYLPCFGAPGDAVAADDGEQFGDE